MAVSSIKEPFITVLNRDGIPLEDGNIYIGEYGKNPRIYPINVYWDISLLAAAVQPIKTLNGHPVNNGTPSALFVNSKYSISFYDKNDQLVYSSLSNDIDTSMISLGLISNLIGYTPDTSDLFVVNISGYYSNNDGGGGLFNWDSTIDKSTANAGTTIDPSVPLASQGTGVGLGCWIRQYEGDINVKYFGAVDSPTTDSTSYVRACHLYANSNDKNVSYNGMSKIAIDADAQIIINTNVDFASVEIYVLNGVVLDPSYSIVRYIMFKVFDSSTPLTTVAGAVTAGDIEKGSFTPAKDLYTKDGYFLLECAYQIPNRTKDGTVNYTQSFKSNKGGVVNNPVSYDLTGYEGSVSIKYRDTPSKKLTISNFSVVADGWNNQCLIEVTRCNVDLNNITVLPTAYPVDSVDNLIRLSYVSDVRINSFITNGRVTNAAEGTYALLMEYVADIYIKNMSSQDGWGSTGTNEVNGLYYEDCNINRYDTHSGCHNMKITNSTIGLLGVRYGWGGGLLEISNCTCYSVPLTYRGDYGGQFDGTISVKNIKVSNPNTTGYLIVDILDVGASVPIILPSIIIDDVRRDDVVTSGYMWVLRLEVLATSAAVYAPKEISIQNIFSNGLWRFKSTIDWSNMESNPTFGTVITLENIKSIVTPSSTEGLIGLTKTKTITSIPFYFINVLNCSRFRIEYLDQQGYTAYIKISDSDVSAVDVNTAGTFQHRISIYNCTFEAQTTGSTYVGGGISGAAGSLNKTLIRNCTFDNLTWDLSLASALIGNILESSGTNITLPATATEDTIFTGFKV